MRSAHPELPRTSYFSNAYWSYRTGDWFDGDPGAADTTHPDWPYWYAPDLIESILIDPMAHEIGCHSFSHVALSDERCWPEVATAELRLSQQLASEWGLVLRSLVFPGNLAGNYPSVRDAGFKAYRSHGRYELDVPVRDAFGLWQVPGGVWLEKPYASWTEAEYVALVRSYIDTAIDRSGLRPWAGSRNGWRNRTHPPPLWPSDAEHQDAPATRRPAPSTVDRDRHVRPAIAVFRATASPDQCRHEHVARQGYSWRAQTTHATAHFPTCSVRAAFGTPGAAA